MILNKYSQQHIRELLNKTSGRKSFTRLYQKNIYNLVRIAVGNQWKIAYPTKQGLFACAGMPFCQTSAPKSFQEIMGAIFKDIEGYVWYLDDIFINNDNTPGKHQATVTKIL